MASLTSEQRNLLERTVVTARDEAEKAARAALIRLATNQREPYATLSPDDRILRNRLRAEARRLGETTENQIRDTEPFEALVTEVAYAQWHRMLFARFLAENGLLMHPHGVPVSLEECAELAQDEGEPDAWMLAARYAARMLPGIFRNDDPTVQVRFDAAGRLALERLIGELAPSIFVADDSLGWVYQFWQTKRKKEVNESGVKIGGADISPVTQLFTEHYMVQFLLHNSLGAWWAARHPGEPLPTDLDYLRRNEDGSPAAGAFSGWPEHTKDLRVLDPCCGSGHFLVAAFALLRRFRMADEGLSEIEAGDAVLRDNLFGLELDPRCTQIAAFALALAAWKTGGYRELPVPNIACTGLPVGSNAYEFTHLADGDQDMESLLRRLHQVFKEAPDLGSLIDPVRIAREEGIFAVEWGKVAPLLESALSKERVDDPAAAIFGEAARGVARAADLLTRQYHLVVTNVPYLARGKQDTVLRKHIETFHNDAKADLATAFVDRCLRFSTKSGSVSLVTPQNWLFLGSYTALRERLLKTSTWSVVAKLGENGFQSSQAAGAFTALFVLSNILPNLSHALIGMDVALIKTPSEKARLLRYGLLHFVSQVSQLQNPDARITLEEHVGGTLLEKYAHSHKGISTYDDPVFVRKFWEFSCWDKSCWEFHQSTVEQTTSYGGMEQILLYENGTGRLREHIASQSRDRGDDKKGINAWNRPGIAVSLMRHLPVALYTGAKFDTNVAAVIPRDPAHLPAIWAFCSSPEFHTAVRRIDQALKVTNASLVKVPFDLAHWQQVAVEQYPNGLPEPHSDDPTQWLFQGNPAKALHPSLPAATLQVGMARLLGYRWPEPQKREGIGEKEGIGSEVLGIKGNGDGLASLVDDDGIVCLPPVAGELPAAQRLQQLLVTAFTQQLIPNTPIPNTQHPTPNTPSAWIDRLLSEAGYGGQSLDIWLQEGFFAQHCRMFHNRPFLWHIWDGRKDGFGAIVNYHKLDRAKLDRLIYTYLGDWIATQRHADSQGVAGANARLVAALGLQEKLKAIADGEPPFDIYVRWKPLHQQPIGWEPDLNDGVRLNIRPFVNAGVLRSKFSINWNKDRGTNPDGTERLNDLHYTRAEKEAARRQQER